ncbi:MAG: type II toxin-antitoxin system VapB family antitoxin [Kyrpidia sp.]|nr:type II toxin-antitoxin system VapB family antitoxin [Kyrpidia sp.]
MDRAKLFQSGRSQAVRLPKKYRFSGSEVFIKKVGNAVVLLPEDGAWDVLAQSLISFSEDFMETRNQGEDQAREMAFE